VNAIELFLFGFAAVIDLALLLAIWERVNRGRVAIWLTTLVASIALIHVAIFLRLMLDDAATQSFVVVDRLLVIAICGGLLLLPSAMLHAAIRLAQTGIDAYPPRDTRYVWLYSPAVLLPMIAVTVWTSPAVNFISQVNAWTIVYLVWLTIANATSVTLFLRVRGAQWNTQGRTFLTQLSIAIVAITAFAVAYPMLTVGTSMETVMRRLATLSPLAVSLIFVWHSMRGRLLPLVMERTFAYAVLLIFLSLVHRLVMTPIVGWLRSKTGIDFFLVEGILVAAVILAVPTLRGRVAESLRTLFSNNVVDLRAAIRQLALSLSQNAMRDTAALALWFADEVRRRIDLDHVTLLLDNGDQPPTVYKSDTATGEISKVKFTDAMRRIHEGLTDANRVLERGAIENQDMERAFAIENTLLGYRMAYRSVTGTVLIGDRTRNDRLGREQVLVLGLVIDQFAATVHNRREESLRQRAERKMLQQEKLSVLGLLSGSLAHELRNPLSSIRTITMLVIEELGPEHECRRDLRMVVSEIDRLSMATNRLLDYAKPEPQSQTLIAPDKIIIRIVCILDYLAKQYHVDLSLKIGDGEAVIASGEASLSEIVFNLVKNAIEAARDVDNGEVEVVTKTEHDQFIVTVCDNGKGIAEDRRATLFQAFSTDKPDGNGLGLYAVNERIRELGGTINVSTNEPCGTIFEASIPMAKQDDFAGR